MPQGMHVVILCVNNDMASMNITVAQLSHNGHSMARNT